MEKTIVVAGKDIVVKELNAPQIADLLDENKATREKVSLAELLMDSVIPLEAVVMSTGLAAEWFDGEILPSDMKRIWDAVEEVNDFLSRMLARLHHVAGLIGKKEPETSEKPSASSPDSAT